MYFTHVALRYYVMIFRTFSVIWRGLVFINCLHSYLSIEWHHWLSHASVSRSEVPLYNWKKERAFEAFVTHSITGLLYQHLDWIPQFCPSLLWSTSPAEQPFLIQWIGSHSPWSKPRAASGQVFLAMPAFRDLQESPSTQPSSTSLIPEIAD